jgi:type VI secretion system protein ImpM
MSESPPAPNRSVGFLGKIPAQPDFVRQNISDRVGAEVDPWLVKSSQNLSLAKAELPAAPVRFVFSAAQCDSIAIGVLVKSQDQVGRSFPLAIYTALALGVGARSFPAIPLAYSAFLEQAEAILADAATLTLEALRTRVSALVRPSDGTLATAVQRCADVLNAAPASELFVRAFAAAPPDSHHYGLFTFRTATDAARSGPSTAAPTVLACPIAIDVDLLAWLELARRCLGWNDACPAFAWVESAHARLLLSLGYASDQLLHFVADARHTSSRLWPLTTERIEAITRARDALGADLGEGASVDLVWTRIARGTR